MIKLRFILFILIVLDLENSFGQKKYDPLLLIPYNDHGKWGWCDTLANIEVLPEFDETNFFDKFKEHYLSNVVLNGIRSTYVLNEGNTGPIGFNSYMVYNEEYFDLNCSIFVDSSDNSGLYNYKTKKILIKPQFDFGYQILNTKNQIFVFKNLEKVICVFDFKTQKIIKTKYISFLKDLVKNEIYFQDESGNYYYLNDKMVFAKYTDVYNFEYDDGLRIQEYSKPKEYKSISEDKLIDVLPRRFNVKPFSGIEIGPFDKYYVCSKNGDFGILNKEYNVYLPFTYDFINTDYINGCFYLIKDDKFGVKIPNTIYDVIEPKYNYIKFKKSFFITKKWSFILFEGEYKGQKVYFGENGFEYFNLN